MQLPKTVKIGNKKWTVQQHAKRINARGLCHPSFKHIDVYSQDPYVFWHELTHAILHDMGEDWRDEKFVVAFSKRLDQAIKTARF